MSIRVTAAAWLTGALWVCACGGSSSETPPPLEPDLTALEKKIRDTRPSPGDGDRNAEPSPDEAVEPTEGDPGDDYVDPNSLPSTWGSDEAPDESIP
jgi:hypothetical protein